MRHYDVIIVGGGASGLITAITAKKYANELKIAILEKKERVGKKLSQTGNGKCNLTNMDCQGAISVISFFSEIGVPVRKDDEGRVYPYSEDANQVTDALKDKCLELGVDIFCSLAVTDIRIISGGIFEIVPGFTCSKVVIAAGGKSCAAFGTTGDGYVFAKKTGHTITPLIPGLTAIEVKENIANLRGTRAKGTCGLYRNGRLIAEEKGEIQFREDSLSGIMIMNLSNYIRKDADYDIILDLVPDFPDVSLEDIYGSKALLKPELIKYIKENRLDPRKLKLRCIGLKGWNEAQITCGGVSLDDVDMVTMESKKVKGMYFTGEILDIQEKCGGYNLNNAWLTGMKAGEAIADEYF